MGGESKEEEFRRDIAYILGTDYSPELLQEFEESLKSSVRNQLFHSDSKVTPVSTIGKKRKKVKS